MLYLQSLEVKEQAIWALGNVAGDSLDFRSQNHHDRGNPHIAFAKHLKGDAWDVLSIPRGQSAAYEAKTRAAAAPKA